MSGTATVAGPSAVQGLTEAELEAARRDREGAAFLRDGTAPADPTVEGTPIHHAPSDTPISGRAFDLIVEFEVSSRAVYERKYRGAIWPGESSGVTIGIGYDVGFVTDAQLHDDWGGVVPRAMLDALLRVNGITGLDAKAAAASLGGQIDIPFDDAIRVHRGITIPRWVGLTEEALPNTALLSPDGLGALVSLTYNRGASYSDHRDPDGKDRFREMRNIRAHMAARAFARIPGEIRGMERLWPGTPGLQKRREREAELFEDGL